MATECGALEGRIGLTSACAPWRHMRESFAVMVVVQDDLLKPFIWVWRKRKQ